jgi:hypothetical protein
MNGYEVNQEALYPGWSVSYKVVKFVNGVPWRALTSWVLLYDDSILFPFEYFFFRSERIVFSVFAGLKLHVQRDAEPYSSEQMW